MALARAVSALRWRRVTSADGRRMLAGIVLLLLILYGQRFYGMATVNMRLDPALRGATGASNVIVVLDFQPDRFHNERVSEYGVFAGRDGGLNRIRLRMVSPRQLRELASIPWIARIEPLQ
jgi:hypothetical protein